MLKFTVIVPCYNGEKYLNECLTSIANQSYDNFEVIFVDNESSDNSVNIAETFKDKIADFKISSAKNIFAHSWDEPVSEALKIMSGDYFTIVAVDDALSPDYLSNLSIVLKEAEGEIECIQSPIKRVFPNGQADLLSYPPLSLKQWKTKLLEHCAVNTPSMVYRRSVYEDKHMTYNCDKYLGAADYDLYCQFIDKGILIHNHQEFLGYNYRIHEDQCTWGMVQEAQKGNDFDSSIKSYWKEQWQS
jgi:glycosyltransferase involved in cell wall biosynthesis